MGTQTYCRSLIFLIALLATAALLIPAKQSHGQLLAYDGFDLPIVGEPVQGSTGGFGFDGPWQLGGFNATRSNNYRVGNGSLSFPGLSTSGNSVTTGVNSGIAGLTRSFSQPLGTPGTVQYISFLLRPEGITDPRSGFFGVLLEQTNNTEIFVGGVARSDNFVLENRGGAQTVETNTPVMSGLTQLLVLRSEFTLGSESFSLYVDPTPGLPEPTTPDAFRTANIPVVQGVTIYSNAAFSFDEFRLGETFEDVLPVPEPSAALAVGFSMIGLLFRRRRVEQ